jgi:SAM-dependent methyltransferase
MADFFKTKFGHEIKLIPEYFSVHNHFASSDTIGGHEKDFSENRSMNFQFTEFFQDFFEYSLMIDYLDSLGIDINCNSALDIGGQQGYISRLLISENKTKFADCVEIGDYSNRLTLSKMKWFYNRYKVWKILRRFNLDYKNHVSKLNNAFDTMCAHYGTFLNADSKFWKLNFKTPPTISNYIVGNVYDINKKYDFISALLCLEYFNYQKLFKKIESLLNDDGIFIFLVNYWWWPVNSTRIVGNFPYVTQRLDKDDFSKYINQFHPDESSNIFKMYDYFAAGMDEKPTLNQYISEAEKNNLSLIGCKRLMPVSNTHSKTPLTPNVLDEFNDTKLDDVLSDIQSFRDDVSIQDLKTAYVMCVFKKKSPSKKSITEKINYLETANYGTYMKNKN